MPIRLSKPALAALGLLKVLGGGARAAGVQNQDSPEHKGLSGLDDLVETGEEVYDAFLLRAKERRDRIESDIKNGISGLLADLGLATRDEIRDLRDSLDPQNRETGPGSGKEE